jgi:hypothetical protein
VVTSATMAEALPTAQGELARSPLAHVLVYALDQQLTGALFLRPPDGDEHVVRLARGAPVKVRPGDRHALLGELLVEAGAIDQATLDAALETALATRALLGDVLLLAGRVDQGALEKVAESQFVRRMVRLFSLPPETTYRYYDGDDALADYGAGPACVDPLALIWAGLREHGEASTMLDGTLARLGAAPLGLHAAATVSRFRLDAHEEQLCEILKDCPLTLPELAEASSPEAARRLAYGLAIMRQLDLGAGSHPLGAEAAPESAVASASRAFARMALRSTVHREGAAAPDLPGDGERAVIPSSRRTRRSEGDASVEEPPSQRGAPPSSAPGEPPSSGRAPPVSSIEERPRTAPPCAPDSGVVAVAPLTDLDPAVSSPLREA